MSYQGIMSYLHPRVIIAKIDEPHDSARGSYVLGSSMAGSHAEFERIVIDYLDYHMNQTMGGSLPPEYLLDKARKILNSTGSFENAVFTALSGTEGGLTKVLNDLAEGLKQEARKAYFDYILDAFIDPLSFEEVVEVMSELQNCLSGYSPQPFSYISPEAMAENYRQILWQYMESLTRYKNLWVY